MNAKISVFVICVEVITCLLLLHNLHDCTFNLKHSFHATFNMKNQEEGRHSRKSIKMVKKFQDVRHFQRCLV